MKLTCNGHSPEELAKRLAAFFPDGDIEWKPDRFIPLQENRGRHPKQDVPCRAVMLAYVTNRAIQERLDQVAGPGNWQIRYRRWGDKGVMARLGLRFEREDGSDYWAWREDGADETAIESTKGGISSASKRVGSAWGIGRYLYRMPDAFCEAVATKVENWRIKSGRLKRWGDKPAVPVAFLPEFQGKDPQPERRPEPRRQEPQSQQTQAPQQAQTQAQHAAPNNVDDVLPWPLGEEPKWLDWRLKFGMYEGATHRWLASGSVGGARQSYMEYLTKDGPRPHENPKYAENNRLQHERFLTCIKAIEARGAEAANDQRDEQVEMYGTPADEPDYDPIDSTPF